MYYFNFYVGVMKLFVRVWYMVYFFYTYSIGSIRDLIGTITLMCSSSIVRKHAPHFNCGCISFTTNMAGKATATKKHTGLDSVSSTKNFGDVCKQSFLCLTHYPNQCFCRGGFSSHVGCKRNAPTVEVRCMFSYYAR